MRGCVSKRKNGSYAYTIELGKHPETKRRRQKMQAGFATKKEAESALSKALTELGRGSYVEQTTETVQEYFTNFLTAKHQNLRPGTFRAYKGLVNCHIIPRLGQILLAKLTPQHLIAMYEALRVERNLSAQTINHVHKLLHDGLATAVRYELISKNVASLIQPPKIIRSKMSVWTDEQLVEFLAYSKPYRYSIIILLAATCGLRRGEAIALRWVDIDLAKGTLSVNQSYVRGEKGHVFQPPKTQAGVRTIALPQITIDALKRQKALLAQDKLAAGATYKDHGLVSQTKNGFPVSPYYFEVRWLDMLRKSGLPQIRYHDLRHTHASLLLKMDVNPKIVSERLGHSSIGITLDRYSHTYGVDYNAANKLNSLLESSGIVTKNA